MAHGVAEHVESTSDGPPVEIVNADGHGALLLVCEHASNSVPPRLDGQLATDEVLRSHAGWDLGAIELATRLSHAHNAPLVAATYSRLIYDLNRPPTSPEAMRISSELYDVPGNANLSPDERARRVAEVYDPFHTAVAEALKVQRERVGVLVFVTIHTFAPVFFRKHRATQIGILHDEDSRFADAMLDVATECTALTVERNAPYSARDGVTHTLRKHALAENVLNVMIEVRNDLVGTSDQQDAVADALSQMIRLAMMRCGIPAPSSLSGRARC